MTAVSQDILQIEYIEIISDIHDVNAIAFIMSTVNEIVVTRII